MKPVYYVLLIAIAVLYFSCKKTALNENRIQSPDDTTWKTYPLDTIPDGLALARTQAYPGSSYVC